jgi:fatty-acyl-CoA synthase
MRSPSFPIDAVSYYARCRPNALACVELDSNRRWSYAGLNAEVDRISAWIQGRFGPASGQQVASLGRNSVSLLELHLATVRAGAVYLPLNWRLTAHELERILRDAATPLLFADPEFTAPRFSGECLELADLERPTFCTHSAPPAYRSADDPATLLYTSGTSGTPKGVIFTETNAHWSGTNFNFGNGVDTRTVMLCDMPMFHVAGLFAVVRAALLAGGTVLISKGFDPQKTLARIADPSLGVTHYFSVPQMAQMLWEQPGFRPDLLRGLQVYATGGAPNPKAQIERFVRAGIPMSDGFGMSEAGSVSGMPVHDPELLIAKAGSCGLPYIGVEARIVDDAGRDVGAETIGELWLRGPGVSPGYLNQPQLTADTFCDGWLKTGDAALRDSDGYYFLVDRRKDMFISGGENVYPAEVEAVLRELEGVAEAAVIGVPDSRWGEVGRAYVVATPTRVLDSAAVLAHCASRLARYKVPQTLVITDSIPRTAAGKILKRELRERAAGEILAR